MDNTVNNPTNNAQNDTGKKIPVGKLGDGSVSHGGLS
jgi:hypothetical protein